jgi:hypothetical protein
MDKTFCLYDGIFPVVALGLATALEAGRGDGVRSPRARPYRRHVRTLLAGRAELSVQRGRRSMSFMSLLRDGQGVIRTELTANEVGDALNDSNALLWVHIAALEASDVNLLHRVFRFHPLAVQDCLNPTRQRPKIDDFGSHLFILVNGVDHEATGELVETTELNLFVGGNFVVTSSLRPIPSVEHLFASSSENSLLLDEGPPSTGARHHRRARRCRGADDRSHERSRGCRRRGGDCEPQR